MLLFCSYGFALIISLPFCSNSVYFFAVIHVQKPLNYRCQMTARWVIPVVSLHSLYVVILVGFTRSIRHVDFRFQELKDLWRGVLVSTFSVGMPQLLSILSWCMLSSQLLLIRCAQRQNNVSQ